MGGELDRPLGCYFTALGLAWVVSYVTRAEEPAENILRAAFVVCIVVIIRWMIRWKIVENLVVSATNIWSIGRLKTKRGPVKPRDSDTDREL